MRKATNMTRRGFIRLISFLTAAVIAFAAMSYFYYRQSAAAKRQIEYNYLRSLENLSLSLENIKNSLNKGIYSNSPQMMNDISSKLCSDSSTAKASVSQLPVTELNLENTNKFLSQVGNYSQSLAKRFANGETLSDEDRHNLSLLYDYAEKLSDQLWNIESMVSGGHLTFESVLGASYSAGLDDSPANITSGFSEVEGTFDSYPMLIYDGPFSDHIMRQEPLMLKGRKEVTKEEALEIAKKGANREQMEFANEEDGNMPAYNFLCDNCTVTVTKAGGLYVYMLNYRQVDDKTISGDKAVTIAEKFLKDLGFGNMKNTYYELNGGICTVNFAAVQSGATIYTDLIKVGVALDNGEIMSFDARGYISAHHERNLGKPKLTVDEARAKLSKSLTVKSENLSVIPSSGKNERYCYEFLGVCDTGQQILVYINADTGEEEQILLLRISDNGTLTV